MACARGAVCSARGAGDGAAGDEAPCHGHYKPNSREAWCHARVTSLRVRVSRLSSLVSRLSSLAMPWPGSCGQVILQNCM